jgi:hypothetical protein
MANRIIILTDARLNMLMTWALGTDECNNVIRVKKLNKYMVLDIKDLNDGRYDVRAGYSEDGQDVQLPLIVLPKSYYQILISCSITI